MVHKELIFVRFKIIYSKPIITQNVNIINKSVTNYPKISQISVFFFFINN